ncbi:MAG: ABC transporter ATP-binding protein [Fusobacteriaceae bacterium]
MAIDIKNLRFSYNEKREILKNINLNIKKGKFTGILGPNGCGKSTLLKTVLGYLEPSHGKVFIHGTNSSLLARKDVAKKVALVPQKSSLSSPISVEDFVLMGRLPHIKSSWDGYRREDRSIVENNLNFLELQNFKNRVALSLSGGEFQRVLLARALSQEPEILLLDEPTSALDLNHAVELLHRVKNLIQNGGITGVAVLHDLNLAAMFCDELVIMKDGKIAYSGSPKDILTEEILLDVYNLKSKVIRDENGTPYVIPLI